MAMGNNSGRSSVSFGKGFFRRADDARQKESVQDRQPVFKVPVGGARSTPNRITSCGVRELNSDGFVVYNIQDKNDIYVARSSPAADFNEELDIKHMSPDEFTDSGAGIVSEPEAVSECAGDQVECMEPADMFVNALKREKYEEIDFGETIIIMRSNEDFDKEIMECEAPSVREAADAEVFEGLYVEGNMPNSVASADGTADASSFCSAGSESTAVTSGSAVQVMQVASTGFTVLGASPVTGTEDAGSSDSVAALPVLSVIIDPVADLMKMIVPGLCQDELALVDSVSQDAAIPDDGLESYDSIFSSAVSGGSVSGSV